MIDPVSASEVAIAGITVSIQAGKLLKMTIENIQHVKNDLLRLVSEVERYRNVLGPLKIMTRELLRTAYKDMELAIDKAQIQETLDTLRKVASNISATDQKSGQVLAGVRWTFKKTEAERLTSRLREEQAPLMVVVGLINASAALRSLQEFEDMKAETVDKTSVIKAFDELTLVGSDHTPAFQTWLGHINTEAFPSDYVTARNQLSDAAYGGDWQKVFELLQHGQQYYQENWVNAFRISIEPDIFWNTN